MKAISIRQPHTTLLLDQQISLIMQHDPTDYRGPVLICASSQSDLSAFDRLGLRNAQRTESGILNYPTGCACGVAELIDCIPMTPELAKEASIGPRKKITGMHGLVFRNPRWAHNRHPISGQPGLYDTPLVWLEAEQKIQQPDFASTHGTLSPIEDSRQENWNVDYTRFSHRNPKDQHTHRTPPRPCSDYPNYHPGYCRWCGDPIFDKNGLVNRRRTFHKACLNSFLVYYRNPDSRRWCCMRANNRCQRCDRQTAGWIKTPKGNYMSFHFDGNRQPLPEGALDHIVPLKDAAVLAGTPQAPPWAYWITNWQWLCGDCHKAKTALEATMRSKGYAATVAAAELMKNQTTIFDPQ